MFNSLSLGRNRNSNSASRSTSETLSAHPLLGSSGNVPAASELGAVTSATADDLSKSPVNLPYKPRQRHGGGGGSQGGSAGTPIAIASSQSAPALNVLSASKTPQPSAVTTASPAFASSNPSPTGQTGNSVTSRLQLQSLKAAGQRMGLGNGSAGIQMLETLFEKAQISRSGSGGDWGEIIKVLTAGKVGPTVLAWQQGNIALINGLALGRRHSSCPRLLPLPCQSQPRACGTTSCSQQVEAAQSASLSPCRV